MENWIVQRLAVGSIAWLGLSRGCTLGGELKVLIGETPIFGV
jgi:hypothetical protein